MSDEKPNQDNGIVLDAADQQLLASLAAKRGQTPAALLQQIITTEIRRLADAPTESQQRAIRRH